MTDQKQESEETVFKRLYGVRTEIFEKMKETLEKEYRKLHRRGGRPPDLTIEDKLFITLKYLREYRTMEHIRADYGVCKCKNCPPICKPHEINKQLSNIDAFLNYTTPKEDSKQELKEWRNKLEDSMHLRVSTINKISIMFVSLSHTASSLCPHSFKIVSDFTSS